MSASQGLLFQIANDRIMSIGKLEFCIQWWIWCLLGHYLFSSSVSLSVTMVGLQSLFRFLAGFIVPYLFYLLPKDRFQHPLILMMLQNWSPCSLISLILTSFPFQDSMFRKFHKDGAISMVLVFFCCKVSPWNKLYRCLIFYLK